jgi:hypothetical protein
MPLNLCSSFVLFNQKIFIEPGTCGSHLYSPTYTVGRDQEDRGSKLASGKKFVGPYLGKKSITEKRWWSSSRRKSACIANVRPSSLNSSAKKK